MAITLVDLIDNDRPSSDVLETFREYAESGAAISSHSIRTIVDKSHLTREELETAYQHLQTGMASQIARGQGIAGLEYFQSMNYVAQMIAGTMTVEDAMREQSDNPLVTLRSELVMAHSHKSKACLEKAVQAFQRYALQTNLDEFGEGANIVNLTQPGPKGIFTKVYTLARYGGTIPVHAYLMGIHATDNLQIAE